MTESYLNKFNLLLDELRNNKDILRSVAFIVFNYLHFESDTYGSDTSEYKYIKYFEERNPVFNTLLSVIDLVENPLYHELYKLSFLDTLQLDLYTFNLLKDRADQARNIKQQATQTAINSAEKTLNNEG